MNGTQRDAKLFSFGANGSHGARRTNEDKRRAVLAMLADAEWRKWSDREIADRCSVGHSFVSNMRNENTVHRGQYSNSETTIERTFIHPKTGQPTTMATTNIGRRHEVEAPDEPGPVDVWLGSEDDAAFNHRAQYSGDFEWYTPAAYVDAAPCGLLTISLALLHPCSCILLLILMRLRRIDRRGKK